MLILGGGAGRASIASCVNLIYYSVTHSVALQEDIGDDLIVLQRFQNSLPSVVSNVVVSQAQCLEGAVLSESVGNGLGTRRPNVIPIQP